MSFINMVLNHALAICFLQTDHPETLKAQQANAHNNNNKIIIQKKAFYQQLEIYLFSPLKEPQTICDSQEVIGPVGREN